MDSHTIDEYIELEKEIASHEAKSPALILQQKNNQMLHLEERIKQQEENVEALDEQTWVWISNAHVANVSSKLSILETFSSNRRYCQSAVSAAWLIYSFI